MAKILAMRFGLTDGKTTAMSLAAPKDGLAREDVEPVMQSIIDKQAILVKTATANSVKSAVIREVHETKLI